MGAGKSKKTVITISSCLASQGRAAEFRVGGERRGEGGALFMMAAGLGEGGFYRVAGSGAVVGALARLGVRRAM